jgi:hypothetical protein
MIKRRLLILGTLLTFTLIGGCGKTKDQETKTDQGSSNDYGPKFGKNSKVNETLEIKGLKIGMPSSEAIKVIESGGSNCGELRKTSPYSSAGQMTKEAVSEYTSGDEVILCSYSLFGSSRGGITAFFVDGKLFYVYIPDVITQENDLPPAVWKAFAEKYKVDPTVEHQAIYTNPNDKDSIIGYKYRASITDPAGTRLFVIGDLDPGKSISNIALASKDVWEYSNKKQQSLDNAAKKSAQDEEKRKKSDL